MNKGIEPKRIKIYQVSKIQTVKIKAHETEISKKYSEKESFYILAHDLTNAIEKAGMLIGIDEVALDVLLFSEDAFF